MKILCMMNFHYIKNKKTLLNEFNTPSSIQYFYLTHTYTHNSHKKNV